MRKCFLFVSALLFPLAASPASAQVDLGCARPPRAPLPFAFVAVNGQCTDLSAFIVAQTKGWSLNTRATIAGATIDLSALFNPDPGISFSATTFNPSQGATSYSFFFGTAIVPDMYAQAIASVQFSVTSPSGTTTVANTEDIPYIAAYGSAGETFTKLGVDAGTNDCVATGTAASTSCAAEQSTRSFTPTFFDNLEAVVTYSQDNLLSTATFNGSITLDQANAVTVTPEPSTFVLFTTGLVVLAGCAARQRRSRRRFARAG
jgi:hypothetical protein